MACYIWLGRLTPSGNYFLANTKWSEYGYFLNMLANNAWKHINLFLFIDIKVTKVWIYFYGMYRLIRSGFILLIMYQCVWIFNIGAKGYCSVLTQYHRDNRRLVNSCQHLILSVIKCEGTWDAIKLKVWFCIVKFV